MEKLLYYLLLFISLFIFQTSIAQLYVSGVDLKAIKKEIRKEGTHHYAAYQKLKSRVDQHDLTVYGSGIDRYNRSYYAQEAAFLSLLENDEQQQKEYADLAFEIIQEIYQDKNQERLPQEGYGLSRAMMQLALALPYNWCREFWTASQKSWVFNKITEALDAWLTYDHANFWNEKGSNWVAVCRGGELILMLAADEENKRKERYEFIKEQLLTHMKSGYGDLGVTQEGMGYLEYGGTFLLKAVYAAASKGDSTLYHEARNHQWWKLAMYAESFQSHENKFLMTGVAGPGGYNEGWASLLLNHVPSKEVPYFLWWYDRHMGQLSNMKKNFDSDRAGTIWSVLYYPIHEKSKDPSGIYPAGIADDHGYYFFRNRWKNENDIMASIMADEHHHGNAWDQPEVFALNLMAYGSRFIGGPSKDRENELYSTLLVDGKYNIEKSVTLTGKTLNWNTGRQSAYVKIGGGALYQQLGLKKATRQFGINFTDNNEAIICIIDSLKSNKQHNFTWQLNVGDNKDNDGIKVQSEENYFKMKGANGYLNGWIIHPDEFQMVNINDPFRINITGKDKMIMTILFVSREPAPVIKTYDIPDEIKVQLNNNIIRYNKVSGELTIQ